MKKTLLVGALLLASPLVARGDFYGGIEALYWKPTHCPIPFANAERENGITDRKFFNIKSDYDWGARGRIGYACNCFFADIGYLWLQNCDHVKVKKNGFDSLNIQGDGSNIDLVRSDLKFRYQHADLRFGHLLHKCENSSFYVYGNVRWMEIDFHNVTRGSSSAAKAFFGQDACFQAGGPGVGLGGKFSICNGFAVGGRLGVMSMIGRSSVNREVSLKNDGGDIENHRLIPESSTCIVPGTEVDLNISYSRRCRCTRLGIVLGYELDYYLDPLSFSSTDEDTENLPMRTCQNVGFGGPYIGAWVKF